MELNAAASAASVPPAITTRGLTKRFGNIVAVNSLDLDLDAGRIYGLLGPNGSGKTTLVSLVPRLLDPTAGAVFIDGCRPLR